MRASTNPLAYCEGGFYGGHLKPSDKIKPIMKTATASFGITALNELQEVVQRQIACRGRSVCPRNTAGYINDKVEQFKNEDGNLYAIYGTPAEKSVRFAGRAVPQEIRHHRGCFRSSVCPNSFHCHVTEDLTPIQKQDLEGRFWNLCNGGKIQYVKYPIDFQTMRRFALWCAAPWQRDSMRGVNLSLAYCDDCGHEEAVHGRLPEVRQPQPTKSRE